MSLTLVVLSLLAAFAALSLLAVNMNFVVTTTDPDVMFISTMSRKPVMWKVRANLKLNALKLAASP